MKLVRLASLAASLGVLAAVAPAAPANAALYCGYYEPPWDVYRCNTVNPLTAYTNNSYAYKDYNEMYEGGSLPVGIYLQTGSSKFHILNATGFAYKSFVQTTARAYCWNRSSSQYSSAKCAFYLA